MEASLYRIIIFGKDISKLKKFYCGHFGLLVTEETGDEWAVLKAGQMEIALHKIGQAYDTNTYFKSHSNTKLVFRVTEDLALVRQQLVAQGVLLKEIVSFDGINALFCDGEDLEGNIFQLEQKL